MSEERERFQKGAEIARQKGSGHSGSFRMNVHKENC